MRRRRAHPCKAQEQRRQTVDLHGPMLAERPGPTSEDADAVERRADAHERVTAVKMRPAGAEVLAAGDLERAAAAGANGGADLGERVAQRLAIAVFGRAVLPVRTIDARRASWCRLGE